MSKNKVVVVFGGKSVEHDVSCVSASSVVRNIDTDKYDILKVYITKEGYWHIFNESVEDMTNDNVKRSYTSNQNFDQVFSNLKLTNKDIFFPVLHGRNGEDGTIQGLFEMLNMPYVGCGVLASAVGMDKVYTKIIFSNANIPQADFLVFDKKQINNQIDETVEKAKNKFMFPMFIKPSKSGSSLGIGKAHNEEELRSLLINAIKYDRKVIVEEFIEGLELECAVLGNDMPIASTVGQIIPINEFYDYEAKYVGDSKLLIPAPIEQKIIDKIREYAVKAYISLGCSGLSRVDFFVTKQDQKIILNEINTMPGFTNISMYPKLFDAVGVNYKTLVNELISLGYQTYEEQAEINNVDKEAEA